MISREKDYLNGNSLPFKQVTNLTSYVSYKFQFMSPDGEINDDTFKGMNDQVQGE